MPKINTSGDLLGRALHAWTARKSEKVSKEMVKGVKQFLCSEEFRDYVASIDERGFEHRKANQKKDNRMQIKTGGAKSIFTKKLPVQ